MYQSRGYPSTYPAQRQPQQQTYREWDRRQQQRFPESPLAQSSSQINRHHWPTYAQPYPAQQNQPMNVAQGERQLSVMAGAAFLLHALINRSRMSLLTGPLGAYLIWRGQTGHCPVYQAMNINTTQPQGGWQANAGWQDRGGVQQVSIRRPNEAQGEVQQPAHIEIRRAVTVNRTAQELYDYWRKLENLPRFMHHLERVEQTGDKTSHWKAKLTGDIPVEWDAEIVEDGPGQRIAWRTKPDTQVQQEGTVEFREATGGRGTIVYVNIRYVPPGGIIGETFGRLLNGITAQQVKDDIGRFKSLMEAGEIATIDGQPAGR